MQIVKLIAVVILICFLGCHQPTSNKGISQNSITKSLSYKDTFQDKDFVFKTAYKDGMVISCGSGCAMQYNVKQIKGNKLTVKVEFSVQMFEDEKETDNYLENFFFYFSKEKRLLKIIRDGENESFLETQMPNSQREFKNFAQRLIMQMSKDTVKPH